MAIRIAISGATGRMGRELIAGLALESDLALAVALSRHSSAVAAAPQGGAASVSQNLADVALADVLIDFTRPAGSMAYLAECVRQKRPMVIGTTGFSPAERAAIQDASKTIPIVLAPNTALGVNVLFKLVDVAAKALHNRADIEVIEAHHRRKIDAPSGTALSLGEVLAAAMGKALADVAVYERYGETGERPPGSIGFATVRGGDIIGDHTALFALAGERIEITHRSHSRATYVHGAFAAARFLVKQRPGLYDMFDVLNLR